MKYFQVIFIFLLVTSCKSNYEGIKRTEIQVKYPSNIYGKPIKWKKWKRKIEYRIFDKHEKLIELGHFGERGGYSESTWNPIDSTLEIKDVTTRNHKKLDFIEYFNYNKNGKLIKRTFWYCEGNKPSYLSNKDTFDYENNLMITTTYNFDGEIISSGTWEIKYPFELSQEIYNQKITSVGEKIVLTKKEEFQYDDQNRLVKVLHKDEFNNLLGFTKYKYKEIR